MKLTLPPGLSPREFERALQAFVSVVGSQWVLATDEDRHTYSDVYAPGNGESYAPSAAVAPASIEEIQAVLKIANERKVPLWPISRGKNMGYGGAAPRMAGTVILDLGRMNRIIEVNERQAYCVVEPGVGFFDLFEYLQENKIPLWMSVPGNAWGSVMGNALDRGLSRTPYGDHSSKVCGLEVVLPNGNIVRTGMGAMAKSTLWPMAKDGFGPSWDQMFVQSNFGIATKMGLWLMPEPESTLSMNMMFPNESDLEWAIDAVAPLRLNGTLQHDVNIGNGVRAATQSSQRDQWYRGQGAMPESVIQEMLTKMKLGQWNMPLRFYGYDEINEANARIVKAAFARHTKQEFEVSKWHRGEPLARSGAGIPSLNALQASNWRGGRGGHMGFSPICAPLGRDAMKQYELTRKRYEEYGFDYFGSFTVRERSMIHVTLLIYDRDDVDMTRSARALIARLIEDGKQEGYGEYRAHVNYMDQIARSYDFNDHALLRLNEVLKDALDPNGILAPGKSGIWPKALRQNANDSAQG